MGWPFFFVFQVPARFARVPGFEFCICLGFGVLDFEFPLTAVSPSAVVCDPLDTFSANALQSICQ